MGSAGLELGGIYQPDWDERPFRIIGMDEHEVFYDCQWEHDGRWTFSGNFNRTCIFYRMPTPLFAKRSQRIGDLPFTQEELKAFRPDLPLRLGRSIELCWNMPWNKEAIEQSDMSHSISADAVILSPYGSKGGQKGGVIVRSVGGGLRVGALMLEAKRIQESANIQTSNGVGLYRLGWQKRLPSYYIGEYMGRAGNLG
jgi:hypothetical protein